MNIGFICALGIGNGHVARCLALRDGLIKRGHNICSAWDDCDWIVVDDPMFNEGLHDTLYGNILLVSDSDEMHDFIRPKPEIHIKPHLQPHLAWVGHEPPAKMVQMGMSPLGIAIENALEYFDFGSEVGNSEWVIGSPGVTSWERCAARIPTMQVVFAESQLLVAKACEDAGAAVTIWNTFEDGEVVTDKLLARALEAYDKYDATTVANAAYALCDGRGVERTIDLMEAQV